ncbi:putative holin-like toxin [Paenibacillus sp. Marseille-P2973]|nr:putative holin-like toxin [Paenibacillus sp. Marseille-P2973]
MEVKDVLTIMIGFGALIIALLTLVVTIVLALLNQKK